MTLLQISYFCEVCRTGNFTRAAENLHVTQPTTTNAVRDLEVEFGVKLFQRNSKNLALTPAGKELYEMALQILNYAEHIRLVMDDHANEKRRLLLGSPNMTNAVVFPELFRALHKTCPDIEIQTTSGGTSELIPLLTGGKLHLILTPIKPTLPEIRWFTCCRSRMLFCVSKKHPLASRKGVTIKDICNEPLLSFIGDNYLSLLHIPERFLEHGTEMKVMYRCGQISTMQELIRSNDGCGFMVEGSFPEDGIVGLPLEDLDVRGNAYIAWTRESERYQVVRRSLQCFRAYVLEKYGVLEEG